MLTSVGTRNSWARVHDVQGGDSSDYLSTSWDHVVNELEGSDRSTNK